MMLTALALAAFLMPLETSSTAGDGFRCPSGRLVSVGDRLVEVRERCGDPDSSERRTETRRQLATVTTNATPSPTLAGAPAVPVVTEETVTVEEWTYDLGEGRLTRHLTFENGRLVAVTTGSRSERKSRK